MLRSFMFYLSFLLLLCLSIPNASKANVNEVDISVKPFNNVINFNDDLQIPLEITRDPTNNQLIDLLILIDGSGSMGSTNFGKQKNEVAKMVEQLDPGSRIRVGVIQVYSYASINSPYGVPFTSDKADLRDKIKNLLYKTGASNIKDGFMLAKTTFETHGRSEAKKVILILSDGPNAYDPTTCNNYSYYCDPTQIVSEVKDSGVTIFSVLLRYQNTFNEEEIKKLATNLTYYAHAPDNLTTTLPPILSSIKDRINNYRYIDFSADLSDDFRVKALSSTSGAVQSTDTSFNWKSDYTFNGNETINLTLEHIGNNSGNLSVFKQNNLSWDSNGTTLNKSMNNVNVTVLPELLIKDTGVLSNFRIGESYSIHLEATGGSGSYSWSIASGSLPNGFTLNSTNGEIIGTSLIEGIYPFTVKVTDTRGVVKTKNLSIEILKNNNANLSDLSLSIGTLTPAFDSNTTTYTSSVGHSVTSVNVTATLARTTSILNINENNVASGTGVNVPLDVGPNIIPVKVTAQDGTEKTYTITVTRAASSNANLSSLTLSEGTLTPVFGGNTTTYTANVGNATTSIDVTATVADGTATLQVDGSNAVSGTAANIPLNVGPNQIPIKVIAQDGTEKTYTITVTRAASSNADLSSLTLSEGSLTPVFDGNTTTYTADVGNATTSIDVTAIVADGTATLQVEGSNAVSGTAVNVPVDVGPNIIPVKVTAQDGTEKTYTITVTRAASSNANLSSLTLSEGTLTPVFDGTTTTYTADVGNATTSIDVIATVADGTATLQVDGSNAVSGTAVNVPVDVGPNIIPVKVTAQDGTEKTYTITVTRAASSNANLSSLTLSEGTVTPVFDGNTTTYTADVGNATTSIDVIATVADGTATLEVDGNITVSGTAVNIPLNVGQNIMPVKVTAQDGTEKIYTITVTRAASSNADLSSLTLSGGALIPAFETNTTTYTVNVDHSQTTADVIAIVADKTAKLKINGNTAVSGSLVNIPLNVGPNTIAVTVTAQNGTVKTYSMTVNRAASSNANLSSLTLGDGAILNPTFNAGITAYTANVGNKVTNIDVTATVADGTATLNIKGSKISSGATVNVPLNVGANLITITVEAQDGTSKTYTITVIRAGSNNATLSNIMLDTGAISPSFDPNIKTYSANVDHTISNLTITAIPSQPTANVKINNRVTTTDTVTLNFGSNQVPIEVIAQDGITNNIYTVTINRLKSGNADLESLSVDKGTIIPNFSPSIDSYVVDVDFSTAQIDISAQVADPSSTLTLNGIKKTPSITTTDTISFTTTSDTISFMTTGDTIKVAMTETFNLKVGANPIPVIVTAQDGGTKIYTITVNRESPQNMENNNDSNEGNSSESLPEDKGIIRTAVVNLGEDIIQIAITREIKDNGEQQDIVILDSEIANLIVEKALKGEINAAQIVISDLPDSPADEVSITVLLESIDTLIDGKVSLEIITGDVKISISSEILKVHQEQGIDLHFNIVPIRDENEKAKIVERTIKAPEVQQIAQNNKVVIHGNPMQIETNYKNQLTKVVFPLKDLKLPDNLTERKQLLDSLAIYIEHSDGEKEVQKGKIIFDEQGNPIGLEIEITKFSVFTIFSVEHQDTILDTNLKDIQGHWAEQSITQLISIGAVNGYPDNTFKPNNTVTRAEFVTMVVKALEIEGNGNSKTFSDIQNHWAKSVIEQAAENRIVNGLSKERFGPNDEITREQMATMILNASNLEIVDFKSNFNDYNIISEWAKSSVNTAAHYGIISGLPNQTFNPKGKATRAEAATIIVNLLNIKK